MLLTLFFVVTDAAEFDFAVAGAFAGAVAVAGAGAAGWLVWVASSVHGLA